MNMIVPVGINSKLVGRLKTFLNYLLIHHISNQFLFKFLFVPFFCLINFDSTILWKRQLTRQQSAVIFCTKKVFMRLNTIYVQENLHVKEMFKFKHRVEIKGIHKYVFSQFTLWGKWVKVVFIPIYIMRTSNTTDKSTICMYLGTFLRLFFLVLQLLLRFFGPRLFELLYILLLFIARFGYAARRFHLSAAARWSGR